MNVASTGRNSVLAVVAAVGISAAAIRSSLAAMPPANAQSRPVRYAHGARLQLVAAFPDRQITGIAVAPDGRIFVNLPRWTVDVPISVAQVVDGRLRPYPDARWNAWRNRVPLSPRDHFVCVQSVVVDPPGRHLWVLDPGSPAMEGPLKNAPKLVAIDLATNLVDRTVPFERSVAPAGSYLNDVRFTPDMHYAFMSDSGLVGAIVVTDLRSGRSRRLLAGDPSTQFDPNVTLSVDGKPLRRPDGRTIRSGSDGIAVSPDGATFYWQALDGNTLYSIPTATLAGSGAVGDVAKAVAVVEKTHPADGLWIDAAGKLYVTNPELNRVEIGTPGGSLRPLVSDPRLRWPDSFAQAPSGAIYVTTSHIQDSPWFHPAVTTTPSQIWRILPRA